MSHLGHRRTSYDLIEAYCKSHPRKLHVSILVMVEENLSESASAVATHDHMMTKNLPVTLPNDCGTGFMPNTS